MDTQLTGAVPALAADQPHSDEHDSVKEEMIAHASHAQHPLFNVDNGTVFDYIETALRGLSSSEA